MPTEPGGQHRIDCITIDTSTYEGMQQKTEFTVFLHTVYIISVGRRQIFQYFIIGSPPDHTK